MAVQIKRYANRKLYNTETSRYITLSGISDLLREGRDIQVIENETGNDISALVLSRVLVDSERKTPSTGHTAEVAASTADSAPVLGELMQRQLASLFTLLRRYAEDVQENLSDVRDNVARWMQTSEDAQEAASQGSLCDRMDSRPPDLDSRIRASIEGAFRSLELPTRADLERLERRLEAMEQAIEKLSKRS